ncbi:CidA/LrgA family protein [Pseudomonas sp. RIT-PI-S]|uniref:CidA/LrgA family protein n=1 Tax=Pseudomonas sp. RIT-PI-S TaxID=3035295 RepID=UPI0021D9783C|nr:CidA/LrgA family protein [Pseudomonas sp. RIT-PI-S]
MLLRGLTWLIVFQLLGTGVHELFAPILPGPIIGLLCLLGWLIYKGEVPAPVELAASSLLRYLPLLLVPPAVGIMVYATLIAEHFWAIIGALGLSVVGSLGLVAWLMNRLIGLKAKRVAPEVGQ